MKITLLLIVMFSVLSIAQQKDYEQIDLLLLNENYSNAIDKIQTALLDDSLNSALYFKLGTAYQDMFRNDSALYAFEKAYRLDSSLTCKSALAKCYYNIGYTNKARNLYKEIICKDSLNYSAGVNLAKISIDESDYQNALNLYEKIFTSDTTNPFLLKQMGYCLIKLDSLEAALKLYDDAFRLNRLDGSAPVQMSTICFSLERYDSADYYVTKGLQILPDEIDFNRLKGEILIKKKQFSNAKEYYIKTIQMGDSSAGMYFKLGYCYYYTAENYDTASFNLQSYMENFQNYFKALEFFEKSYSLEKDNAVNCYYAGLAADKVTKSEKAIFYFNECIQYSIPKYMANAYRYLANNNQLREHYIESIDCFKKAFFYDPDDKELLYYIANLYSTLKDEENAAKYFREFIKLKENKSDWQVEIAKQLLKQLKIKN